MVRSSLLMVHGLTNFIGLKEAWYLKKSLITLSNNLSKQMKLFKNKDFLTFAFFILLAMVGSKKNDVKAAPGNDGNRNKFRVVGYFRYEGNLIEQASAISFNKITHLNVAFINPDSNGTFIANADLKKVAAMAHRKGVQILASIGGGNPPAYLSKLINQANQAALIANLVQLTTNNNLDGIDVDLEGSFVDENYESFVVNLAAALKAKKKLITAAVATAYKDRYTDNALAQYDFINVMSYDKTGPWNLNIAGPHSPYNMAVEDLAYWNGIRMIAKGKLSLGVPFYGYGFGANAPASLAFKDIITAYPGAEDKDEVVVNGGGTVYYNGIPTIKSKTELALDNAGGIMIWQLLQDASGPNSLLGTINRTIKAHNR